ncbi:MAG: insulinase family protein [Candidatus Obscuribacterales bacterium]|nr:insulinase family protein [Candidatus Obscuribacterales bacterium]
MKVLEKDLRAIGIKQIGEEALGVREFRLNNGLKILLAENHSAPVLTYMQLFRVGSRDEGVGHTGATHFLEHMMFKGTRKFDPEKGLDSTELLNRIGAVSNATTWFDRTNYFEAVPSEYLEFCIKVEADRMRNLRLRQTDRDTEMSVVRDELERGENSPDEALEKEMYAIAFREHPYHHPTIGWRSDVEGVPMSRLRAFYDVFYWPNNCTIILVGNFQTTRALQLIAKYYGRIPTSPHPIPEVYTIEPPQEGERRYQISRAGDLPRVWIGHRTPASTHEDHYPLNVISHILGGSHDRGSRLYKSLIDTGLAMEVACRHDELKDPALMILAATLTPEADPRQVEEVLLNELSKLAEEPVSEEELAPIRSANYKGSILARADQMEFAFALGEAEARADWRWLADFDAKFDAAGPSDIMRVAREYFVRQNRTVGYFIPTETASVEEDEAEVFTDQGDGEDDSKMDLAEVMSMTKAQANGKQPKQVSLTAAELDRVLVPAKKSTRATFSSQVHKEVLENGLRVLHMPIPGTGSVAVSTYLRAGNYFEPRHKHGLADAVADMLLRGSEGLSKDQLAQLVKELGLIEGLNIHADSFAVKTAATVVSADLARYLQVLSEVFRKPIFLEDELAKLKSEWAARITEQKNNTGPAAVNRLYRELYPEGHLFHQKDFDNQLLELDSFSREDLIGFHQVYSPSTTIIVITGDIEREKAIEFVREIFADWQGPPVPPINLEMVEMPSEARRVELRMPDKSSMDIVLGYPLPVKFTDPEFYPLSMANLALGGDTITSRLGKVIREQHGLTYGVYSNLGDNAFGASPWTVSLTVNPTNASTAISLLQKIMEDYRKKGITKAELARETSGAAGLFTVNLRSSIAIARAITRFESLGLGVEGMDRHVERILSVKKAQVDEVIQRYLHPDRMVMVLAGTF